MTRLPLKTPLLVLIVCAWAASLAALSAEEPMQVDLVQDLHWQDHHFAMTNWFYNYKWSEPVTQIDILAEWGYGGAMLSLKDRFGPDVNVEFLIDFIEANTGMDKPFLAYYTSLLPHFPWVPTPDSKDQDYKLPSVTHKGNPKYFPDMVTYLDKNVGRIMQTLEELGIADNTVLIFLADNGTDRDLQNSWGDGKSIAGGKGTMTDRGTHVPLIVRWPKHIKAGSTCDDLIDFSDLFPTLCELSGAPLPQEELHGRSFLPQFLSNQDEPRQWVHVQDKETRHIRNREYILNNKNQLRPVVEIWEPPAKPNQNKYPEKEQAARKKLQAVFDDLGK